MFRRNWKIESTRSGRQRGVVFLLLYLLVFPRLNAWVQQLIFGEGEVPMAEANVVYYAFLFALALLAFWDMLKKDFGVLLDWLPENLLGVLLGLAGGVVLRFLLEMLPWPVADPISLQYAQSYALSPAATLVLILLLIPLVEEVVFRGLIYGHMRNYSRPLAAVTVTVLYALFLVYRYALESGDPRYLLLAVLYLPMSAALTFCYENGGSVWGSVVLHGGLNAFALLTAL